MPRTTLTESVAPGPFPTAGVVVTADAADIANQNRVTWTGRALIIAHNTGASGRTVTITSVADRFGRTGTISAEAIAAGVRRVYGPFTNPDGWRQSDGYLYLEANNAEVVFMVITLPATL